MDTLHQKKSELFINLLIILSIGCGITAITSFVLYTKARMKEEEQLEKKYLRIHYISLFLLLLIGIIYMLFMVETAT